MASCDVAINICQALRHGVTRSKGRAQHWTRNAAEKGHALACLKLAQHMYHDLPYAREAGHVVEAAGVDASAGVTEGHDVPPDVLNGVVHWLHNGGHNVESELGMCLRRALVGAKYCHNEGCEVGGLLKDFKVCPQCKTARYCGDACQKQDWTTGGHKECGTFAYYALSSTYAGAQ
jgi:TPR repeat protein